jgi:hypothetical protein
LEVVDDADGDGDEGIEMLVLELVVEVEFAVDLTLITGGGGLLAEAVSALAFLVDLEVVSAFDFATVDFAPSTSA